MARRETCPGGDASLIVLAAVAVALGLACRCVSAQEARSSPPRALANELAGIVVYSDAQWGLAFVHDGARTVLVEPAGRTGLPASGRRVEVRGRTGRVRGVSALTEAALRDLGPAPVPDPEDDMSPGTASPIMGPRWSRLVGFVREVSSESARTSLRVAVDGVQLEVHVPEGPRAEGVGPEVGDEVRLRGVLEPAANAWSRPVVWVAGWRDTEVLRRAPEWLSVPAATVAEAVALWRSGPPRGEIRLRVRPLERQSVRTFLLEDETGRLSGEVDGPDSVISGALYQARGFLATRRGGPVLVDARWRPIEIPSVHLSRRELGLRVLTRISQVRALSKAEAERGYPVRLRAVVTYTEPGATGSSCRTTPAGCTCTPPTGISACVPGTP